MCFVDDTAGPCQESERPLAGVQAPVLDSIRIRIFLFALELAIVQDADFYEANPELVL
jgi:hypothetical protein